jgi:hypothetical protein
MELLETLHLLTVEECMTLNIEAELSCSEE